MQKKQQRSTRFLNHVKKTPSFILININRSIPAEVMRQLAATLVMAALVFCARGTTVPNEEDSDERQKRSAGPGSDPTLPRLGDLVPGSAGILNQDYIPLSDCQAIYESGLSTSGLYNINPDGNGPFLVYCDMSQLDGTNSGWTLFQRRRDGCFDFNRRWADYRNGFGNLKTNFWLGLERIKRITDSAAYSLYIAIQCHINDASNSQTVQYAKYGSFNIGSEIMYYKLSVGKYNTSSTAGESLISQHNGKYFSTRDRDNDNSLPDCARNYQSGWWFSNCTVSNLNGVWQKTGYFTNSTGIPEYYGVSWKTGESNQIAYSFNTTVMAVRRI